MSEGVIYRHTVAAFVERVIERRGLSSPELSAELLKLGLDVTNPKEVDLETWALLVRAVAARLCPGKPDAEALTTVGREMLAGFSESLVGRSLFLLLRLLGPQRAMLRMPENYQSADSVSRIVARTLSPTSVELSFANAAGIPDYVRGVMLATLDQVKAKNPMATFAHIDGRDVFVVSWSA